MDKNIVLIIGESHLAYRLKILLERKENFEVLHTTIEQINKKTDSEYILENIEYLMGGIDLFRLKMVYLIDEKDENNLQMIIAFISKYPGIAITASLFNENLIPHLQIRHKNLVLLNPAKISAPVFVETLNQKEPYKIQGDIIKPSNTFQLKHVLTLVQKLLMFFLAILITAVCFFHYYEGLSWINSLYFVIVTASSVGYGDINLVNSDTITKLAGIFLILSSTIFIWMIFSLTIDHFLKKRMQLALGRKKYNLNNHVIICGLGRLGYFIVEELIQKGEKIILIEQNEHAKHLEYFRQLGVEVYIGDCRLPKVLNDVNVTKAKALFAVINDDFVNVEIGLNARSLKPDIKLILRVFDEQMAEKIKEQLNIHHTLSVSAISYEKFYEILHEK